MNVSLFVPAIAIAVLIGGISVGMLWRLNRSGRSTGPLGGAPPSPLPVGNRLQNPCRKRVGAWANGMSASWPLVALSFDEKELQLRGAVTISVNRQEVVGIEPVTGALSSGFRMRTPTGRLDRVMVGAGPDVLVALAQRGWPVSDQPPQSMSREIWRL